MTESVVVSRLRIALHESQVEINETKEEFAKLKANYEMLLLQIAPMRLVARAADLVDHLAARSEVDETDLERARSTRAQAIDFYREAMDSDRLSDISRHFDRVVSLRAAAILDKSGDPRTRTSVSILKNRARIEGAREASQSVRIFG